MSCSTNFSNLTPPFRVQVPGPSTALNVSGSQASNKLTACSAALVVTRAGALELALPSWLCGAEGPTGCEFLDSQATASAATNTTKDVQERVVISGSLWPEPDANATPCPSDHFECTLQGKSSTRRVNMSYAAMGSACFQRNKSSWGEPSIAAHRLRQQKDQPTAVGKA